MAWGRCTHPSGGTDVATDSPCKHVSQSLHLWQLTLKNCEQLQSKKHRVRSQSRCKARYGINPENWQMESIWFKLQQIYLSRRKKQKEETGSNSLSAPCAVHSDFSDALHTSFDIRESWKESVRYHRTSDLSAAIPPWPVNCSEGLAEAPGHLQLQKDLEHFSLQWKCWFKSAGQIPLLPFISSLIQYWHSVKTRGDCF